MLEITEDDSIQTNSIQTNLIQSNSIQSNSIQSDSKKLESSKLDSMNIMKYLYDKDYENKICLECKSPLPNFVSINNSIIICGQCAEKHKQLGFNISYIRGIKDDWDPYLLSYLERGGNSRFIRFSKKYDLNDMPIEEKFKTRASEYYRLLVRNYIIIKFLYYS